MTRITTLETCDYQVLVDCFNEAFSDYFVPINVSLEDMKQKVETGQVVPELSVGVFEEERLVGLIFTGVDNLDSPRIAYNAGTCVVPEHRGKRFTSGMYEHLLPIYREVGIEKCVLEVIEDNAPAIKAYENVGYRTERKLLCFKGKITESYLQDSIVEIAPEWEKFSTYWNWNPTWQNAPHTLERDVEKNKLIGHFKDGVLISYACYNPNSKRIHQYAVHADHRRKGYGTALFRHIGEECGNDEITTINVDEKAAETIGFLKAIGMKHNLTQLEMVMRMENESEV